MTVQRLIEWGSQHPKKVFLLDAGGAILSAFLLGVVLVEWSYLVGIPKETLYLLAALPCLFVLYDLYAFRLKTEMLPSYLKGIVFMNVSYCLLSVGMACYHWNSITFLGWTYLLIEILIILALSRFEWKVACVLGETKLKTENKKV